MGSNSTVRRRRLGRELKQLRADKGLTLEDVHKKTRIARNTVTAYESGHTAVREPYVKALLDLYEATEDVREALLALAKGSGQRGWRHVYGEAIPPWFEVYVGLEEEATSIRTFDIDLVPGLLQTPDYYRAVIMATEPEPPPEEVDRKIAVRLTRQQRLTEPDAPALWAIVDEAALRREPGAPETTTAQLQHLIEMSSLPNVTLQILPFSSGLHPAMGSPFVILDFPDPVDPDVVYIENLTSSLYLESPDEVSRFTLFFDHLRAKAREPKSSRALIAQIAKELT